jgi:hypothetical protein
MGKTSWIVLSTAIPTLALAAGVVEAPVDTRLDLNWKLVSDRDAIQVFVRHTDTSRLKAFRGVTRFALADEYALAALFNDYASMPEWMYGVDSTEELRRDGPLHRYLYITTDLPWPLTNRDAAVDISVQQTLTPREESIIIRTEGVKGLLPDKEDYVRMPELHGIFKFRRLGDNELEATYETVLDPGGNVPSWAVNYLARDIPYFTLDRLRRFVQRPEYRDKFVDYLELRGPKRPAELMPPRSYLYGFPPDRPFPSVPAAHVNELKRTP